jgi:hypothetical protein
MLLARVKTKNTRELLQHVDLAHSRTAHNTRTPTTGRGRVLALLVGNRASHLHFLRPVAACFGVCGHGAPVKTGKMY